MFNEQKVAQMSAFFLNQSDGKKLSNLKLMTLLYIAERESVREFGYPMSEDKFLSMPHGPVLSMTLELMNGNIESQPNGWEFWVSDKENHEMSLRNQFISLEDLDELSCAELELLQGVWNQFGTMDKWQISKWTHENCVEWKNPHGSIQPIDFQSMACAVGFNTTTAKDLQERINEENYIEKLFKDLSLNQETLGREFTVDFRDLYQTH